MPVTKEITIENVTIQYNNKNVKILNSYKVQDVDEMIKILIEFKIQTNYETKRTLHSWVLEWRSHNIMYKLHLFRSHTTDCDLEENEKLYRRIFYNIIGGIYR